MQVKRLREVLKRLIKLYDLGYCDVSISNSEIVLNDQNKDTVATISTKDGSTWIDFRLVEEKTFPEDPSIDRFGEAVKESPDDDIPF